jgi:ubiquinone/menaquinone biosynthesis C-methylase UbiE
MPASVSEYYHTLESRIGYRLVLGGTRHFGYYEEGTLWPFPISSALRRMEERLYQTLGLEANALVLDAGAGTGDVAIYMARKGLRIKAIDLLDMHVQWGKANVKRNHLQGQIEVSQGDYERLDFENDSFDGAYTMETLVHAGDPFQAMREFYRVLKPGGVVTHVTYEHDMGSNSPGRSVMSRVNAYAHMPTFEQYPLGTTRKSLEDIGFEEIEVQNLTQNVAPMMRFFFLVVYIPYLIIQLLGLEAYFVNAMAAVELWRHRDHIRYLMFKARKPLHKPSDSDGVKRRLKGT